MSIKKPTTKNYVDNFFKNDIDFNDAKLENIAFVKVNYQPATNGHLTTKMYVDNAIDEISLVKNNQDNDFNNYNLTKINGITLNTQAVNDIHAITKAYVHQIHHENERPRRDLGLSFYNEEVDLVKNNQDNDFNDRKLTNIDSITNNREPDLDNQVTIKKYVKDTIEEGTMLRFNQTLQNYLKVSVGNDIHNLTKNDKIQITGTTKIKFGKTGANFLQN